MRWILNEFFRNLYPALIKEYKEVEVVFKNDILTVSEQFQTQLQKLLSKIENPEDNTFLQERIKKAAVYFLDKINIVLQDLLDKTVVETDNKDTIKRVNDALAQCKKEVLLKQKTLETCENGFSVPLYLIAKSKAAIDDDVVWKNKKREKAVKEATSKVSVPQDILHPELYEELRTWRLIQAQAQNVPAYIILSQMALIGITNLLPQNSAELLQIAGVGKVTLEKYGEEILEIVKEIADIKTSR
jgi:superfamily II DNA helicase RecQ